MTWRAGDPQSNEAAKVRYEITRWTRGKGLDLGCGPHKCYPHFIGVDNGHHWGTQGVDVESDCTDLSLFADSSMNFVFSSHLLEHIEDTAAALKEWWRVIKTGGYLVLYLPHKSYYPNIGEPGCNPDHKHDFLPKDIVEHMNKVGTGWDLLINENRNYDNGEGQHGNEYSFFQVFRKAEGKKKEHYWNRDQSKKTCCVVRYGGYGDHLQASSILPGLKEQGYFITYMTQPEGYAVMRTNPNIDEWFIQDHDQVPQAELTPYWNTHKAKYDKWVNLSESVERTLLVCEYDSKFDWPAAVRRKHMNLNYLEFTHELAEVPYVPAPKFYPTEEENQLAIKFNEEKHTGFNILWGLSGSSLHKFYPWQDNVIAKIMAELPNATIVTTGDGACQLLEQGWEEESRVINRAGRWSMRRVLTQAIHSCVVVGPETGVLNAVSHEPNKKVVFLSHSTTENLTRDWVNTTAMEPNTEMAPCYPCHQLHYNRSICPRHEETTAAICAAAIDPDDVFQVIKREYDKYECR